MIEMSKLWLHSINGLHGPRCPLSDNKPITYRQYTDMDSDVRYAKLIINQLVTNNCWFTIGLAQFGSVSALVGLDSGMCRLTPRNSV